MKKIIKAKLFVFPYPDFMKKVRLPAIFRDKHDAPELGKVVSIDDMGVGTIELNEEGERFFKRHGEPQESDGYRSKNY